MPLWASGRFDEADAAYLQAAQKTPGSARALFGRARTLAALTKLDEALDVALTASAASPRDGEIHALIGELYERMHRYDEAANALRSYINLLPNKERSQKAAWARAQADFLESFTGVTPVEIDAEDRAALHTLPFRLVNDKVVVRGPHQRQRSAGLHSRHRVGGDHHLGCHGAASGREAGDLQRSAQALARSASAACSWRG